VIPVNHNKLIFEYFDDHLGKEINNTVKIITYGNTIVFIFFGVSIYSDGRTWVATRSVR
jgi:hypothetical protein